MFPFPDDTERIRSVKGSDRQKCDGVMEGGEEADGYHKAISLSPLLISSRDQALRHTMSEGKHTLSSEQSLLIYLGN